MCSSRLNLNFSTLFSITYSKYPKSELSKLKIFQAVENFYKQRYLGEGIQVADWQRWQLSIESHFVGVHGPYELHRKEEQIKFALLSDAIHMAREHRQM